MHATNPCYSELAVKVDLVEVQCMCLPDMIPGLMLGLSRGEPGKYEGELHIGERFPANLLVSLKPDALYGRRSLFCALLSG